MATLQRLALRGTPKATKAAARYTPAGGAERCGMCRHYVPSSSCARIEGPVSAAGWCQLYSQQVTWRPRAGQDAGGSIPAGVALDLSFMSAGTLDPRITFTRASTATYFDATGTMQTAAINAPRWDYDPVTHVLKGLLLEDTRTNILLNSATLGTQSVAVTAQLYTLSFYGTGTITKSGTVSGALAGTGAFPTRVSQSFTPTAGTLTLTVTGSVLNAQLEATQDFPTSYIPTTGAAVTRAIDSCLILPANMGFFTAPGGSWCPEFDYLDSTPVNGGRVIVRGDSPSAATCAQILTARTIGQFDGAAGVNATTVTTAGTIVKTATTWAAGRATVCTNGGPVASGATLVNGYPTYATAGIRFMSVGGGNSLEGHLRRVRYWSRALSDAELQQVTT